MITVIENGDIFKSKAQTWVNTVNTVGIMGKGIALGFKRRFPYMYEDYVRRCRREEVRLGRPYLFKRDQPPWILNFPTKGHWRSVAQLSAIIEGLEFLEAHYREWGIQSLAVPPLGSGEGKLEWRVVGPTLYRALKQLEIPVELYAPFGTPHEELQPEYLEQLTLEFASNDSRIPQSRVPPAWVAIVDILRRVQSDPYHWPVGRVIFEKIAYFAQAAGIDTGLTYKRSSFGPHSSESKKMLTHLVNNGLINEREPRQGQMWRIRVGPTFSDALRVFQDDLRRWSESSERVADLIRRFRSTSQAEIAATVHYSASELTRRLGRAPTEAEVLEEVMSWKAHRKPGLKPKDVAKAIRNLALLRWIDVAPTPDLVEEDEVLGV